MELETVLPAAPTSQSAVESAAAISAAIRAPHAAASVAIRMSDVQPRPLHWLWRYWLALGKLALLDGDPGQAKSMLLVDLAARVSSGQVMPDGSAGIEGDVTFFWPED